MCQKELIEQSINWKTMNSNLVDQGHGIWNFRSVNKSVLSFNYKKSPARTIAFDNILIDPSELLTNT